MGVPKDIKGTCVTKNHHKKSKSTVQWNEERRLN